LHRAQGQAYRIAIAAVSTVSRRLASGSGFSVIRSLFRGQFEKHRATSRHSPFDVLLTRFVHERLLYRLSRSPHADRFVLKSAMLLTTCLPETARGTRDLDLLAMRASSASSAFSHLEAIPFAGRQRFPPSARRALTPARRISATKAAHCRCERPDRR
jgi:hypothetical protein